VLKELLKSKNWEANQWFVRPVDPVKDGVPDYHKVIKKPMDLGTMQEKLNLGEYNSVKDFENDFNLIIKNCRKFNGPAGPVSDAAGKLEALFKQKWAEKDEFIATHGPAQAAAGSAPSPGTAARDESGEDGDGSEPEVDEEAPPATSDTLDALMLATSRKTLGSPGCCRPACRMPP